MLELGLTDTFTDDATDRLSFEPEPTDAEVVPFEGFLSVDLPDEPPPPLPVLLIAPEGWLMADVTAGGRCVFATVDEETLASTLPRRAPNGDTDLGVGEGDGFGTETADW